MKLNSLRYRCLVGTGMAGVVLLTVALIQWPVQAQTATQSVSDPLVITSLPVAFSITRALLENTGVEVINLPPQGRPLNGLPNYFESRAEQLAATFARATAVVTMGKLWPEDPLFTAARQANIRIVDIDATKPWSNTLEGVTVAMQPQANAPWSGNQPGSAAIVQASVWYWLSLTNGVRSTDIIASDLLRLFPQHEARIIENQHSYRSELLAMHRQVEQELSEVADITVFSLAPELVYLTSEMGLFVDGSFYKQDIDWSEEDALALENTLKQHDVRVVLHKWEPLEPILDAIHRAGAELVVVEPLETGLVENGEMRADSYQTMMQKNLDAVVSALRHE